MSPSQADKAARLQALHRGPAAFVMPNPWDAGSARLLAGLGFDALATSSGASAAALGKRDGQLSRGEVIAHVHALAAATSLPVSADLDAAREIREQGTFGHVERARSSGELRTLSGS